MSITANELLMSRGGKSAAFPTVGTTVTGRLTTEPKVQQQTDIKTGDPKFFANGDPMMQIVVSFATDQRDPADPEDDGVRQLYVKANMLKAIREAVKTSGAKGLEVGGTLSVTYTADGEVTQRGFNPPKLYTATYQPPTGQAANNLLMGAPAASPAAPSVPAGVDSAVWAQLDATQRAGVLAAMGAQSDRPPF